MLKQLRRIKKRLAGFTLIELLITIGILVVLLSIVLLAINPVEQFNKTSDIATNAVVKDFASATKYFYTSEKATPWVKDSSCAQELATKDTLSQMPSCTNVLTEGGQFQEQLINSNEAKEIFTTQCSNSLAFCYKPKSNAFKKDPNAIYQRNGAPNPKCPNDDNCYSCDFTTNEAKECFEIMSPNTEKLAVASSGGRNEVQPVVERPSVKVCGNPGSGEAACMADVVTDSAGNQLTTLSVPNGLSPEQIHKAYNLPCAPGGTIDWQCDTPASFGPETIAIVDAFHYPTVESDLALYNATFGLPPCTKANGCLTVVNQNGETSPLPSGQSSEWTAEAAMDVQSAHATCQTCKIILVEAENNMWLNLATATRKAAMMEGVIAVSNSYGNTEVAVLNSQFDEYYNHPGVAITASSGDWGYGTLYPASSKNVIGVGGTELYLFNDNTYASERVWGGAGSGCSILAQSAGPHQTSLPNWAQVGCGDKKAVSDVSAVASPYTGMAVYIAGGWRIYGGTSLASPIYAATIALQGGIPQGSDGDAFPYTQKDKFRDITVGSNGGCGGKSICTAGVGFDGPTGLGTPNLLPQEGITPTVFPTSTPTLTPTPTPNISSSDPSYGYIVGADHQSFSKVTIPNSGSSSTNCNILETHYCSVPLEWQNSGNTGHSCKIGTTLNAIFSQLNCNGDILNEPSPTPAPTLTPTPIVSYGSFIIDPTKMTYTRITNYALKSDNFYKPCVVGETIQCSKIPVVMNADNIGQCETGNSGYAVWSKVSCAGIVASPSATLTPTPTVVLTNTPTPTAVLNCSTQQTVTLAQSQPILALPGDTINNILTIKSNNTSGCPDLLYTISSSRPSGWTFNGMPASTTVEAGATKSIYFTIQTPANATAGNYGYQFWVAKPGETSPQSVSGSVQIAQVGPTNTPTPTPINCFQGWSNSLGSTSLSGNAGDTLNQTLTITYNNPPGCGGIATFGISHGYPTGWVINNLPASVQLTPGQSTTIPFTITISTGAQIGDYGLQYWVNSGGQPMNATVHVIGVSNPPEEQLFSNFHVKAYGNYALFEYSYNATGAVGMRLDVSTDPNGLNTTAAPAPAGTRYGFAFNSGSAMDASNHPTPSTVEGLIVGSPSSWAGWQCGATIYYRIYNDGDKRIKSPVQSTVVDCNTLVDVLPWNPWYAAIYQGVFDGRYDADHNGIINYTDYWLLVRATRLR